MAMDDPWGSPWADETQTPHPIKLKENGFAFKPTTPVKAASLALEQKTSSPWDDPDDDGFGEWAVGTPEKKEKGLGLDGADDGWTSNVGDGPGYGFTIEGSHALSGKLDDLLAKIESSQHSDEGRRRVLEAMGNGWKKVVPSIGGISQPIIGTRIVMQACTNAVAGLRSIALSNTFSALIRLYSCVSSTSAPAC